MACRKFTESIGPRRGRVNAANSRQINGRKVGGLLLPGALPNRAYVRCLGGSSECNGIIVSTCVWPVTAEPYRAKTAPLPRSSILVRPHRFRPRRCGGKMVEAPGTAPGSETLMPRGVYRHSRFPDSSNIGARIGLLKAQ